MGTLGTELSWSMTNIFSQVTAVLYASEFARCLETHPTTRATRSLSAYDHFLALCFGQLTFRQSLREVIACLSSRPDQLYQMGFRGNLSRTNLAYANAHRDWRLFFAIAQVLMRRAARLYHPVEPDPDSAFVAFALDSSVISLSLKLFPWGYYARSGRAAVKLHLMLSLQGNLPAWGAITEAHCPDVKILDRMPVVAGATYIMDRGYLDFIRLFRIHQAGGWFVVRAKRQVRYRVIESRPTPPATDLIEIRRNQVVRLTSEESRRAYPQRLRKVIVYVLEEKRSLVILTNNLQWSAEDIAQLYKSRWQVELFFKWIKQHLRLRNFYGRSENAVRCQIWSAICTYLMVAILKKELKVEKSLYEILQLISVNPFERLSFCELLSQQPSEENSSECQKSFVFNEN
jgi:hypothetical protein